MKSMIMSNLKSQLKSKILPEHYCYYCGMIDSYEQAMKYLQRMDSKTFVIFSDWFMCNGKDFFKSVADYIVGEKIDTRFDAFMRTYTAYLQEAIEDESKEIVTEFLYIIPKQMKEDFQKFGFIDSLKNEFMWECELNVNKNVNNNYYMEPDIFCQVLLA